MTEQPIYATSTLSTVREPIPRVVVLATWVNSWLTGKSSADDVTSALDVFGPQRICPQGSPGGESVGLAIGLNELGVKTGTEAGRLRVVLPTFGDPSGLPGPDRLNQEAIAAGQAAIIDHVDVALIPHIEGDVTTWCTHRATPSARPGMRIRPEEAASAVKTALLDATTELAELDLASGRDDVTDALTEINIRMKRISLPRSLPGTDQHTIHSAAQILGICEVALAASRPAPTSALDRQRVSVLTDLAATARHCLAAAASPR